MRACGALVAVVHALVSSLLTNILLVLLLLLLLPFSQTSCAPLPPLLFPVSLLAAFLFPLLVLSVVQIFGTPSELVEMFDTAHVLIFLIVVLFVGMVSLILWRFASFCEVVGDAHAHETWSITDSGALLDSRGLRQRW